MANVIFHQEQLILFNFALLLVRGILTVVLLKIICHVIHSDLGWRRIPDFFVKCNSRVGVWQCVVCWMLHVYVRCQVLCVLQTIQITHILTGLKVPKHPFKLLDHCLKYKYAPLNAGKRPLPYAQIWGKIGGGYFPLPAPFFFKITAVHAHPITVQCTVLYSVQYCTLYSTVHCACPLPCIVHHTMLMQRSMLSCDMWEPVRYAIPTHHLHKLIWECLYNSCWVSNFSAPTLSYLSLLKKYKIFKKNWKRYIQDFAMGGCSHHYTCTCAGTWVGVYPLPSPPPPPRCVSRGGCVPHTLYVYALIPWTKYCRHPPFV